MKNALHLKAAAVIFAAAFCISACGQEETPAAETEEAGTPAADASSEEEGAAGAASSSTENAAAATENTASESTDGSKTEAETPPPADPYAAYSDSDRAILEEKGYLTHHTKVEEDNLTWTYDADTRTLTITGSGPMKDYYDAEPEVENGNMVWEYEPTTGWAEDAVLPPWAQYANEIENVVIGEGVTSVGDYAFCSYPIYSLSLPDSVEYIGKYAFMNGRFDDPDFPANLKEIAEGGYMETRFHMPLVIPEGVEIIGKNAFYANVFEDTITIPATVIFIDEAAFSNGLELHEVIVSPDNPYYTSSEGVLFTKDMSTLLCYPIYKEEETYTIPSTVTRLGRWAFGQNYFLRKLTIPASVKEFGAASFAYLHVIEEYEVEEGSTLFKTVDGVLYTADGKTLLDYPSLKTGDSFAVPAGVETIGDGKSSFFADEYLKRLYIPDTVKRIEANALKDIYDMDVYIAEGVIDNAVIAQPNFSAYTGSILYDYTQGFVYIPPEERTERDTLIEDYKMRGEAIPSEEELQKILDSQDFSLSFIRANAYREHMPATFHYEGSQEKWDAFITENDYILGEVTVLCGETMPADLAGE